ncbi:MAG TPA: hypothetical protein VGD64_13080 [Acidisarcina sp.]
MTKWPIQADEADVPDTIRHAPVRRAPARPAATRPALARSAAIGCVAVACILFLVFAATLQVAHSHVDDKAADHCQICFAIHSAMPAEAVTAGFVFTSIEQPAAELIHAAPPRFWISPYANGPPVLKSA